MTGTLRVIREKSRALQLFEHLAQNKEAGASADVRSQGSAENHPIAQRVTRRVRFFFFFFFRHIQTRGNAEPTQNR